MKLYEVTIEKVDNDLDSESQMWVGSVVAPNSLTAERLALADKKASNRFDYRIRSVIEAGETNLEPKVLDGEWGW